MLLSHGTSPARVTGSSRQAGELLGEFTQATKPDMATALLVAEREASAVLRLYPLAGDADASLLVDIAALRGAIELEGAFYAEQVAENRSPARLWLSLLESKVGALDNSIGGADDGESSGRQLAAAWSFPTGTVHAPGSECPQPIYCEYRRLRW